MKMIKGVSWLSFCSSPIEQITENSTDVGFANIRKEESSSNRHMPLVAKVYNHGQIMKLNIIHQLT